MKAATVRGGRAVSLQKARRKEQRRSSSSSTSSQSLSSEEEEEEERGKKKMISRRRKDRGGHLDEGNNAAGTLKSASDYRQNRVFRKIERDIKDKNRKKKAPNTTIGRYEEQTYIDKDRAIAVGIGAEDLKGHIMKHRGDLMKSNLHGQMEGQNVNVILEQAEHELKHGDPEKSLAYLNRGLRYHPESVECMVLKSRCLLLSNKCKEALSEANTLIHRQGEATNSDVLTVKGDALYFLGSFEHSLVNYYRALRYVSSKEREGLLKRVHRTKMAVLNTTGPTSFEAEAYFDQMEANTDTEKHWRGLKQSIDPEMIKTKEKSFLTEITEDKLYLDSLMAKLHSHKHVSSKCLKLAEKEAKEAVGFLRERTDFWMQHTPMSNDRTK